jgi:MoxR-like ATPase
MYFFSMRFLLQRPLLKAILSDSPTVLLIDEIDRADAEFEAFLLEVLSDFQVTCRNWARWLPCTARWCC